MNRCCPIVIKEKNVSDMNNVLTTVNTNNISHPYAVYDYTTMVNRVYNNYDQWVLYPYNHAVFLLSNPKEQYKPLSALRLTPDNMFINYVCTSVIRKSKISCVNILITSSDNVGEVPIKDMTLRLLLDIGNSPSDLANISETDTTSHYDIEIKAKNKDIVFVNKYINTNIPINKGSFIMVRIKSLKGQLPIDVSPLMYVNVKLELQTA